MNLNRISSAIILNLLYDRVVDSTRISELDNVGPRWTSGWSKGLKVALVKLHDLGEWSGLEVTLPNALEMWDISIVDSVIEIICRGDENVFLCLCWLQVATSLHDHFFWEPFGRMQCTFLENWRGCSTLHIGYSVSLWRLPELKRVGLLTQDSNIQ